MHENLKVGTTQSPVPVIRDVTSVHDLAKQVAQVFPWHLGVRLQVIVQYIDTERDADRQNLIPAVSNTYVHAYMTSAKSASQKYSPGIAKKPWNKGDETKF